MIIAHMTVWHVLGNFYFKNIFSCRDTFKDLVNLQEIYLYTNKLAEIPAHLFQVCKEVKVIELDDNKITMLDKTLYWGLKKLTRLTLLSTELSVIDG